MTLGFVFLLGLGGIFAAVFYTFIIGLAGAPGALLSLAAARRSPDGITPIWGLFLTVAGQLYVSLIFVTLVIRFVESHLEGATGHGKWFVWCVAFFVAITPTAVALKDAAHADHKNIQHYAMTLTNPLSALGFILFLIFPSIMNFGWGWVPQL